MAIVPAVVLPSTGWWNSPFSPIVIASVLIISYSTKTIVSLSLNAALFLTISATFLTTSGLPRALPPGNDIVLVSQWGIIIFLVGTVTSYLSQETGKNKGMLIRQEETTELANLRRVNKLLGELQGEAKDLSFSFDEEGIAQYVFTKMESFTSFDKGIFITSKKLFSSSSSGNPENEIWETLYSHGRVFLPSKFSVEKLPAPIQEVIHTKKSKMFLDNLPFGGLSPQSQSAIYVPLTVGNTTVGVIAIESSKKENYGQDTLGLVEITAKTASQALANSQQFKMFKLIGANEERERIARELHDTLGQSLAYVLLSSDNLTMGIQDEESAKKMTEFSQDVRSVVADIRDTLYDLRTNVTPQKGFVEVLEDFIRRVEERSDISINFNVKQTRTLSITLEKEFWRIAQEAIINADKHSECKNLNIDWTCDAYHAELTVSDDGKGFHVQNKKNKVDSYGLSGMEERAAAIGAKIDIASVPEEGTVISCLLQL